MLDMHYKFGAKHYDWEPLWRYQIGATPSEQNKYVELGVVDTGIYFDKAKLSRLPIIEEPLTLPDKQSKTCVIIPVYRGTNDSMLEKVFFKTCLWNIRAILKNTDIYDHDISIKIFTEVSLKDRFRPYLEACNLNYDDCIFYEDEAFSHLEGHKRRWAQKTYTWHHPKLQEFSHVLIMDADIFIRRISENERVPIFEKINQIQKWKPENICMWGTWINDVPIKIEERYFRHGFKTPSDFLQAVAKASDIPIEKVTIEWTGKTIDQSEFLFLFLRPKVSTKLVWLPIQWFNKTYPDYERWSQQWIQTFISDEPLVATYFYMKNIRFDSFNRVYPLSMYVHHLKNVKSPFIDICFDKKNG